MEDIFSRLFIHWTFDIQINKYLIEEDEKKIKQTNLDKRKKNNRKYRKNSISVLKLFSRRRPDNLNRIQIEWLMKALFYKLF